MPSDVSCVPAALHLALSTRIKRLKRGNIGAQIPIPVNETFLLKLGEGYDWNITIDDQTIISRVVNVMVVRGAQGLYEAHKPGSFTLTAFGDPICRGGTPPCAAPSQRFIVRNLNET